MTCGQPGRDNQELVRGIEEAEKVLWRALARLTTISSTDYSERMSDANDLIRHALWKLGGQPEPGPKTRDGRLKELELIDDKLSEELAVLRAEAARLWSQKASEKAGIVRGDIVREERRQGIAFPGCAA